MRARPLRVAIASSSCREAVAGTARINFDVIDEALLTFDAGGRAQKAKYRGELFPADAAADPLCTLFRDFFQRDREGNPKGIIVIDLEDFQ